MTFKRLFDSVIKYEGYYANVAGDSGGETYMGIARSMHPNWNGWMYIDDYKMRYGRLPHNHKINSEELTENVMEFYKDKFHYAFSIDKIDNVCIQEIIFDWCVNSGRNGIKGVQNTLNIFYNKELNVDGFLGEDTVSAINNIDSKTLFNAIKESRIMYYHEIAQYGQNYRFLDGWLNRINSISYSNC